MSDQTASVRVRMIVRDYVTGADQGVAATERFRRSQERLGKSGDEAARGLNRAGDAAERSGRMMGRGMLYTAAGVAAVGAAGGALKILPGLLAATGVVAGTLPGILTGAAAAAGVLKVAVGGVGDAIKEVTKLDDPFARLSPNARALVAEVKRGQPALQAFQQGLQNRALAGAAQNLNALGRVALPAVSGGLNDLATDWSVTFREMTLAVTDPQFTGAFNTATRSADEFFDGMNKQIRPTVRSIGTLVSSADPVARAFGKGLTDQIDRFNTSVEKARRSGQLAKFFEDGAEGAEAFMELGGGILRITGQVVSEVGKQNGTLRDTADRLSAYINSGRSATDVAGIVGTLTTAYEGLKDTLGPLATIARDAFGDEGTRQAVQTLFDILNAGTSVLRILFDAFQGLPDGVQGAVLAILGLVLVGRKLNDLMGVMDRATGRAADRLGDLGANGERAGRALTRTAAAAKGTVAALIGMQVLGVIFDQFAAAPPDIDALGDSIERFAKTGQVSGEATRVFGENLEGMNKAAGAAAGNGFLAKFGRSLETIAPFTRSINEALSGGSFTGSVDRFKALDSALAGYARTTNDSTGTIEVWNRVLAESGLEADELAKIMPNTHTQMQRMSEASAAADGAIAGNTERTKILAGSFREAALAGKDLAATMDIINGKNINAAQGQIALEEAYDTAAEAAKRNGAVVKKGTHEIDLGNEKGRENMATLLGISRAATVAADAENKRTGTTTAGLPILDAAREKFITLATKMTGSAAVAKRLADEILGIPDKDVHIKTDADRAIEKLKAMGFTVKRLPNGKFEIKANTAAAKAKLAEAKRLLDQLNGGRAVITVEQRYIITGRKIKNERQVGETANLAGGVYIPMQRGGVRAAQRGLVQPTIYPPSDPPLYQFAEKETGGELFLPRRGDRERGRDLLAIAATWYHGMFVPMRRGGVTAAAAGLVNVGAASTTSSGGTSRLDSLESYLRARDAVKSLTDALKENGRTFSWATAKGRANTEAVMAAVRAAQDAARSKFEETGSVAAANRAYDQHIARLRKTLQQQKVNAATIRQLLSYAARPAFAGAAPANSLANIAFARSNIAATAGIESLRDALSLNAPGAGYGSPGARDNLSAILAFLEQAAGAAQDRYTQTSNAGTATALYNAYIAQLRDALTKAGFEKKIIDELVSTYGRITLTSNARGGVYMAAAGLASLRDPAIYPGGDHTMYGFAERGTGGELFLPRNGAQARGRDLLGVAASWYGGQFVRGGQAAGSGGTVVNNNLTVNEAQGRPSLAQMQGLLRQLDVRERIGRPG